MCVSSSSSFASRDRSVESPNEPVDESSPMPNLATEKGKDTVKGFKPFTDFLLWIYSILHAHGAEREALK
jgi:hypothetical protein